MKQLPEGLWPVMITPFTSTGHIDLNGLEKLVDFYIQSGCAGLFANCLSSEMYQLTEEERLLLTASVVKFSKGRVPVVATGSFSRKPEENVTFIKKIHEQGVHAVILITSLLVEPDEPEDILRSRLEYLMSETGAIPLGVYECPVPYKRLLSPGLMNWMASSGRFVYHKDTSCNSVSIRNKIAGVCDTSFGFYNADTPTALDSLDAGARGISPISANFYPEPYTWMLKEYKEKGRTPEVNRIHAFLTMMDRVTHTFYPFSSKYFLQQRGLDIGVYGRIPQETPSNADYIRFSALMESFNGLCDLYGIRKVL